MKLDDSWKNRAVSAQEAVACLRSGTKVFLHGACATSVPLEAAMCERSDLENVQLFHLHKNGPAPFAEAHCTRQFRSYSLFTGGNLRGAIEEGRADFVPIFLSDIPWLFESHQIPLDVAILQVSYPDAHGYCSLGTSVDTSLAAAKAARVIVAEINRQVPRTLGHSFIHLSEIAHFILSDRPLLPHDPVPFTDVERAIGRQIAELVDDGSTLQMGIGGIPDAALAEMFDKQDLGVHTEMFSDRVVDLVEAGVINNSRKTVHHGRLVTSFVNGSQRLFDFVDNNPAVEFHPCDYTNDTALIRKHDRMVAINSALEIDMTGQVCADSIGTRIYSGIGGQMDFIRGAALSREGKPIIALPSTAKKGTMSRLVATLKPGAGVVTTRGHIHWVVTEFGAVNLHGLSLRQRGEAMISIAHPDFQSELRNSLKDRNLFLVSAC